MWRWFPKKETASLFSSLRNDLLGWLTMIFLQIMSENKLDFGVLEIIYTFVV